MAESAVVAFQVWAPGYRIVSRACSCITNLYAKERDTRSRVLCSCENITFFPLTRRQKEAPARIRNTVPISHPGSLWYIFHDANGFSNNSYWSQRILRLLVKIKTSLKYDYSFPYLSQL